jgi:hypothetical protein
VLASRRGEGDDAKKLDTGNGTDCLTPKNTTSETDSVLREYAQNVASDLVECAARIFPGALETLGIASSVREGNRNRLHALVARAEMSF